MPLPLPSPAPQLRELLRSERIPCEDCYDKSDLLNRLKDYLMAAPTPAVSSEVPPFMAEEVSAST